MWTLMASGISLALVAANEPKLGSVVFSELIEANLGSEIITTTDLSTVEKALKTEHPDWSNSDIHDKAFAFLLDGKLISKYLQRNHMDVTSDQVNQQFALTLQGIKTEYGFKSDAEVSRFLEERNLSFDRIKDQIQVEKEREQFQSILAGRIPAPTETEALAFYQNNPELFKSNFEYTLSECVIPATNKEAEQKAKYYEKNPRKFDECVKKVSQSPSAAQGGALGTFKRGQLKEEAEAKIFALKKNQVAVLLMQEGPELKAFQLIKAENVKDLGAIPFEVARDNIKARLRNDRIKKEADQILAEERSAPEISVKK